jgi:hypothetical protein
MTPLNEKTDQRARRATHLGAHRHRMKAADCPGIVGTRQEKPHRPLQFALRAKGKPVDTPGGNSYIPPDLNKGVENGRV